MDSGTGGLCDLINARPTPEGMVATVGRLSDLIGIEVDLCRWQSHSRYLPHEPIVAIHGREPLPCNAFDEVSGSHSAAFDSRSGTQMG